MPVFATKGINEHGAAVERQVRHGRGISYDCDTVSVEEVEPYERHGRIHHRANAPLDMY